jgi:hypothetical protein
MSGIRALRVAVGAGALVSLGCGVVTVGSPGPPGPTPDVRRIDSLPRPPAFREDCTRHITAAHAALATMATPDSVHTGALAHHMAMHDYHVCLSRVP